MHYALLLSQYRIDNKSRQRAVKDLDLSESSTSKVHCFRSIWWRLFTEGVRAEECLSNVKSSAPNDTSASNVCQKSGIKHSKLVASNRNYIMEF